MRGRALKLAFCTLLVAIMLSNGASAACITEYGQQNKFIDRAETEILNRETNKDEKLTIREAINLIEKSNNISDNEMEETIRYDLFQYRLYNKLLTEDNLDNEIDRGTFLTIALSRLGLIAPLDCNSLDNPYRDIKNTAHTSQSTFILNAYALGIINGAEEFNSEAGYTFKEACKILNKIKSMQVKLDGKNMIYPKTPDYMSELNYKIIGYNSFTHFPSIVSALNKFNNETRNNIIKQLNLIITNENQSKYLSTNQAASGCYFDQGKRIVIFTNDQPLSLFYDIDSCLTHEIGHYIYFTLLDSKDKTVISRSYKEDSEIFTEAIGRDYAKTNKEEYFAELVSNYCKPYRKDQMREILPSEVINVLDKFIK